ncbi:MAG: hypothetical protein FWD57_14445 [Polyangiaceae bacterium]|nr:hypothetical protein [Polyangiaceae bacterium]
MFGYYPRPGNWVRILDDNLACEGEYITRQRSAETREQVDVVVAHAKLSAIDKASTGHLLALCRYLGRLR